MKTGKDLITLVMEIERQQRAKKDYIANTAAMQIAVKDEGVELHLRDTGNFPITTIGHEQISEHTGIPKRYYDRMRTEAPDLLANNVNRWFEKYPAPRMIRTLDGNARAFLSDSFKTLDNYDFATSAFPILHARKLKIMSAEITEKRLYIKAVDEKLFRDVPVGYRMGDGSHKIFDTCAPAIILSNSEIGFGRLVVETGVYTSACTNMALFAKGGMKKTHVGARHRMTDGFDVQDLDHILSDATKRKTMDALWSQVSDVIAAAFDESTVTKRLIALEEAAGRRITADLTKVMEVTKDKFSLTDTEGESILRRLAEGGSLTQYGLHSAITRAAQDVESYDRATELEYLGGRIIDLPAAEWRTLAEAA